MKKLIIPIAFLLCAMSGCNKEPYMPDGPATRIEFGSGDRTYNNNNDDQNRLATIRVMTYNIHHAEPPKNPGAVDMDTIAETIRKGNPDIVFLQEVDKNTGRAGYSGDQAKALGEALNMNAVFYSARPHLRGHYGVAILSKYPLEKVQKHMLTVENEQTEQRVLGTAIVDLPGIDSIMVAATHLQHNSATNRVQQVQDIARILGTQQIPTIIGGDLNEFESTTEFFSIFDATFKRTCAGANCPFTFSAQRPASVIDYLAFRPVQAFNILSHDVIHENYASDHLPVLAELQFNR